MRDCPIAAKIQVPAVIFGIKTHFFHAFFEFFQIIFALRAADYFA
jgi:hypothetical protein